MIEKLATWFDETPEMNGILISKPENIYYLSGFWGSFGFLIWSRSGKKYLVTDGRYAEKATQLAKERGFEFILFEAGFAKKFGKDVSGTWANEDSLTLEELDRFETYLPNAKLKTYASVLENIRRIKTSTEIEKITMAQAHVDKILIPFLQHNLQAGITEQVLNFKLQQALQDQGKYGLSFPSIIAFGESSSHPHHVSGDRKLKHGDNILVDCGVTQDHYCSDMTRNFIFGKPDKIYLDKYRLLLKAQQLTHQEIKPGASTKDIDAFCRKELGDDAVFFTHSLGHGVGLEIHELPTLSARKDYSLQTGEVVTNEPGIYYPNQFGIRIEDLVVVTDGGAEILSKTPRDLLSFDEDGSVQTLVHAS